MRMAGVAPLAVVQRADAQASAPAVACPPATPITLTGTGPARTAFLLYFGSRAVSGGSVNAAGHFSITLVVGRARAGDYPVLVRLRSAPRTLLSFTCTVPAATSAAVTTPIPVAAPRSLDTAGADLYNCSDFATWDEANAVYQANLPGDPNHLDSDGDGIPCESLPGAP
jgi:hypothetical protein